MRRPILRAIASRSGPLVSLFVRLLSSTWRVEIEGAEHLEEARDGERGILYCFWHGRMLELASAHARRGVGVLVSGHPDGIMAERIVRPLGYVPIRGSSRRNPVAGFRAMLRHASAGGDLALTPDAHSDGRVQPGAIALARRTGHALLPVAAAADRRRRVDSWDRFEIPWPGARVRILYGEPVLVPADADRVEMERCRSRLEAGLRELHRRAERAFSAPSSEPVEQPGVLIGS
ncbi:MAG TPA: lysophospholipid acyltransferase family protein [Gemmatimonadota bacterium]|nr:lysophospholipid acyltransferase family protein [Gemmatimonadota bacterium]